MSYPERRFEILLLSTLLLITVNGVAQTFNRVESRAQLSHLKNNNGIAVADIDGDDDLDIYVVTRQHPNKVTGEPNRLLINNNDGTFTDITASAGIAGTFDYGGTNINWDFGLKMGASWGDFDNDGFPDLFLTSRFHNRLYKNNGDLTFSDVTAGAGIIAENSCYSTGATWWDYDGDGFLDLYITTWGTECGNTLMHNNGDGTFSDNTALTNLGGISKYSWMSIPIDINEDGLIDLYIANDYDDPNELYINNSNNLFTESAELYNVMNANRDGMGLAIGDYNNDTELDLFVTNINENSFYVNGGNLHFEDNASQLGVYKTGWSWGTSFVDIDNDSDEDLIVANGFINARPNAIYKNQLIEGTDGFMDAGDQVGITGDTKSNGITAFDYDNDGDQDILISNTNETIGFYENFLVDLNPAGQTNWVNISLRGTTSNRDAIGAFVEVVIDGKPLKKYHNGSSFLSQSLQPVHFGLGSSSIISTVSITWPSGLVENYSDVAINTNYRFTEGTGVEVLQNSFDKISGCTDPNSCNYNPLAIIDDGSCTYLNAGIINGNSISKILGEDTYTYSSVDGTDYTWQVENGEILEGQGTPTINVKWGIASTGKITVSEYNGCAGLPVVLDVQLSQKEISGQSIARIWNEAILAAIRTDLARPTIHARNLWHSGIAMYDAWAAINKTAETYILGKQHGNYVNTYSGFQTDDPATATHIAISYASYRLLTHRFKNSPSAVATLQRFDAIMDLFEYDKNFLQTDYGSGNPAALGNYIAESIINFGNDDGANEQGGYANLYYSPINPPLEVEFSGNPGILYPNHWQPIRLRVFIDQSGNLISDATPAFLSPEWGSVIPFALNDSDVTTYERDGALYKVYLDPGLPPQINTTEDVASNSLYKWNFSLVSMWSSHLDPTDGIVWDISPKSLGNIDIESLPSTEAEFDQFYDRFDGGDIGQGRAINPITNEPYVAQNVHRGDYARVLAEFWADGPNSETPPGHWFVLLNYVNDHPAFTRRFKGTGSVIDQLEWDVKAYFTLGGAMHDAAVASWGIKGWYDFVRPVSAIRFMGDKGQSSDSNLDHYDVAGFELIPGYIELIQEGDPLQGSNLENVGKIKLYAWKGHPYISNPDVDDAGVGWILAENWWPYQRPSFVTPPFAGYISGHSTYSRAAAEVLTLLTGSEYFPGGMGEFLAKKNEFLVFEEGPSEDVILQWATYRDASDQCSLSRIWGGIHPPADDIPGRRIGEQVGKRAFALAEEYFNKLITGVEPEVYSSPGYPNPVRPGDIFSIPTEDFNATYVLRSLDGRMVQLQSQTYDLSSHAMQIKLPDLPAGLFVLTSGKKSWKILVKD